MCGIYAAITRDGRALTLGSSLTDARDDGHEPSASLERSLRARGPDHMGSAEVRVGRASVRLTSTVLGLRGEVTPQPLVDGDTGSALCWNGEAWSVAGQAVGGNDGRAVFGSLLRARRERDGDGVMRVLREVRGEFAFVYVDRPRGRVYFGRDRLGRRSLLVNRERGWLASVADAAASVEGRVAGENGNGWEEVEGVWVVELGDGGWVRHDWESEEMLLGLGTFNDSTAGQGSLTAAFPSVTRLRERLMESLRLRVTGVPVPPNALESDARIAVLFSGGLDCTVLARMASDMLPPEWGVDLINVAFENPRIAAVHGGLDVDELCELCPDRITGRKAVAELRAVCPNRRWNFITVNVAYKLAMAHRARVMELMYPHNTEMDLSISLALYFASRGEGVSQGRAYATKARVLISGLGADELFGGYARHAHAFWRGGYAGLAAELKLDLCRLGRRNLGRDDRVMACWGREVRFPYLDEEVVRWAMEAPAWEKCDFANDGHVEAGKRVLRLLAEEMGMRGAAGEKKRAIQFGARTAKMESGKVRGDMRVS